MSEQVTKLQQTDEQFMQNLRRRNRRGKIWSRFFFIANTFALLVLIVLAGHIINQSFGLVIIRNTVEPATLSDRPLEELTEAELVNVLVENQGNRLRVIIRDSMSQVPNEEFTTAPLSAVLAGRQIPEGTEDLTINDLTPEQLAEILSVNLSQGDILDIISNQIIQPRIERSWRLIPSVFDRSSIEQIAAEEYPDDILKFQSWLSLDFINSKSSSSATTTGLQTALIGSAYIMIITVLVAIPLGVGAAIYLEEYSSGRSWVERLIEINIRNLASVPSIIYGMLGLAVFVRALGFITSGRFLGIEDSNGRTILSAALTLALLILPVVIINAQEAIRAVPSSIRDASYGLGATKWQTVWRQVLPAAAPGILTGVILGMSRAVGETAPLIVVGATTFIGRNPGGPFDKFTVVPIQIFQWTSEAVAEFKNVAAAAIIVLLVVMITLNLAAIILRNRYSRRAY